MATALEKAVKDFYLERTKRNQFWTRGQEGQLKVKKLKIGVAGLGGMGSNIAEIFARLGVGHLRLADPDIIEASNINRQVIANTRTLGKTKLEACVQELNGIDPEIELAKFPDGITADNAEEFVKGLDVVINEIDVLHMDTQMHLLRAARKHGLAVYTTLVVGVGIHLYKYSPTSDYTAEDFLGTLLKDASLDNLLNTLGQPLPAYMQNQDLADFKNEIVSNGGIPIFGASTYLGQSLLAIRVLSDLGCLRSSETAPPTPCLPEFLVLDPLTLELKTALISGHEHKHSKSQ